MDIIELAGRGLTVLFFVSIAAFVTFGAWQDLGVHALLVPVGVGALFATSVVIGYVQKRVGMVIQHKCRKEEP